jgi:hypothetical protein
MPRHELVQTLRRSLLIRAWRPGRRGPNCGTVRVGHRELAQAIRCLPERFTDRLPDRTLQRISIAASGGQWQQVLDDLIGSLHAHNQPVTAEERDQLHAALEALSLPTGPLHELDMRH